MPQRSSLAAGLLVVGLACIVLGLLAYLGALSWFGRLPVDVRLERSGVRIYVPLVSMLVSSVVLTVVLSIIRRFW